MTKRTIPIRYRARVGICLLMALLMTPVMLTWQAWRQARLDNALIVALRHHDDASAIKLLNQGANARQSIPLEDVPPPTFWQMLRSRFSGKSFPKQDGASCLMWALGIDTYPNLHDLGKIEWSPPNENPALIRALLACGADPNLPYYSWTEDSDRMKMTPLLLAASWRHPTAVQLLLDHHADPNGTNHYGLTPLMAVGRNLVTDNRDFNNPDFLARGQSIENMLLAHGANTRAKYQVFKDEEGSTAFSFFVGKGQEQMFQTLLDHEPDAKIRQHEIDRALVDAVNSGDKDFVRFLLAHHADVNTKGTRGNVIHDTERDRHVYGEPDAELIAILRHAGAKD